jgi:hypothetical protein
MRIRPRGQATATPGLSTLISPPFSPCHPPLCRRMSPPAGAEGGGSRYAGSAASPSAQFVQRCGIMPEAAHALDAATAAPKLRVK